MTEVGTVHYQRNTKIALTSTFVELNDYITFTFYLFCQETNTWCLLYIDTDAM